MGRTCVPLATNHGRARPHGTTCLALHLCRFRRLGPLPPTAGRTASSWLLAATAAVVRLQNVVCHRLVPLGRHLQGVERGVW